MFTLGIDVSHWEGVINWQVAAPFVPFVYMKCTDGCHYIDITYNANQTACAALGVPHAPYHYWEPSQDPIEQAQHFFSVAGRDFNRYIVDVEEKERLPDIVTRLNVFLLKLRQLTGVKPTIYTSAGYWNEFMKPYPSWAGEYDLIVAHYTSEHSPMLPIGWDDYIMWQFSDNFFIPGIDTACDGNWFSGNLAAARLYFGNYQVVDPPPTIFQVRSYFDNLHIRQSPNKESREVGHLKRGDVVQVEQLGGKDCWIRHPAGWSAVEIDGYRYMEVIK